MAIQPLLTEPAPSAERCEVAPFPYRVFGLGMNKTGTTSLGRALRMLGVLPVASQKLVHRAGIIDAMFERGNFEPALRFARMYRSFEDRPWNLWDMYQRLDERYPGSRFVLTVRDADSWWRSTQQWISVSKPTIAERYQAHLRATSIERDEMVEAYRRYNAEVMEYFAGRSDLLVMNLEEGDGWRELCALLDVPVPSRDFPHANRQRYDDRDAERSARADADHTRLRGLKGPVAVQCCISCEALVATPSKDKETSNKPNRIPAIMRWGRGHWLPSVKPQEDLRLTALRRLHPELTVDDMAIVTTLFNPTGVQSRVTNYHRFRERLQACGLPLLTVELAVAPDRFMLSDEVGQLLQVRSDACLWHKERLLNLGIRELIRQGYRKIVWLDADIVFSDTRHWPWYVAAALQKHRVCQVFGDVLVEQDGTGSPVLGVSAIRHHKQNGSLTQQSRKLPSWRRPFGYPRGFSGYGWAARAEVLEQVELYDHAVVGGGDKLIFAASCGIKNDWHHRVKKLICTSLRPCKSCGHVNESPGYLEDYYAWAERWNAVVEGQVGWANQTIRSYHHGNRRGRRYHNRRDILLRHQFDPRTDLAMSEDGCIRWGSDKHDLHLEVHNYFFERKEDD